jgi:hypothetical protein
VHNTKHDDLIKEMKRHDDLIRETNRQHDGLIKEMDSMTIS